MTNKLTENDMVEIFLSKYQESYKYVQEVPIFAKSIDLVRVDLENKCISAIEFKISKWKKAIMQVLGSSIAFDYLEICVLKPRTEKCQKLISNECVQLGIGLYYLDAIEKTIEHAVEPVHCNGIWETQKMQVLEYLERRLQK